MNSRKENPKQPLNKEFSAIIIISVISLLISGLLLVLFFVTDYKPLLLVALIEFLPIGANFILLLPVKIRGKLRFKSNKELISDKSESINEATYNTLVENDYEVKDCQQKTKEEKPSFYNRYRSAILSALIISVTVIINAVYWIFVKQTKEINKLSYFIPVAVICTWVAFLILARYCKYLNENKTENTSEYYISVINGLKGGIYINMFSHIILFIGSVILISGVAKSTNFIIILLSIIFVYESLFILFSLLVRVIRKEMNKSPSLTIPVPGAKGNDLSIINYLENNTGISMRSLWSIKLIKIVLPYTLIGVFVLLWGFSGIVNIESYQQGAHYRFGKLQDDLLQPGLHLTLPLGIDSVDVYDTQVVNKMTIGYSSKENEDNMWTTGHDGEEYKLLLGGGKEVVCINLRLEYKITDLRAYIESSKSPESILQASAYEVITQKTINTSVKDLLASDRSELSSQLMEEITQRASRYNTGLSIVSVVLESIHPPIEVADIYQEIISAGIEAEKIIINAQAKADVTRINAENDKNSMIHIEEKLACESKAEATAIITEFMGCVDADNTYGNKYRYEKYLKAITKAYGDGKFIIVGDGIDQKNIYIGNFVGK